MRRSRYGRGWRTCTSPVSGNNGPKQTVSGGDGAFRQDLSGGRRGEEGTLLLIKPNMNVFGYPVEVIPAVLGTVVLVAGLSSFLAMFRYVKEASALL